MVKTKGFTPKRLFLTTGVGRHREKLASFELALRDAGIQKFNLVHVSSIFPPGCEILEKEDGLQQLTAGEVVFCVISEASSNEPGRRLCASIGIAIPQDRRQYGYLSEHHNYGQSAKEAGDYAEDLAAEMLASTLGIHFDVDSNYDEKREIFKIDGRIVQTQNVTAYAEVDDKGKWTTTVAAAVFVT
ncbi:MAG: arginine decarboxylase, pyruvoyl-dependent [Candidatus Thermoplasmatota archaeon]|jgi:arginine decarboxylase|nr:arginine decarboxylase, pyruvoyl-dependent [Candidatus Thermoplasmatota archaeon]